MISNKLTDVILNLWSKDKLGPLYLIRPPLLEPNSSLEKWSNNLEVQILMGHYQINFERATEKNKNGHPDLLNIYKDKEDKHYKVDNSGIEELFKMQAHKSIELNRRFVFIHDGELIKSILANKLLKVLEDPRKDTTIFILNNTQKEMIQTIESRAVKLSLIPDKKIQKISDINTGLKECIHKILSDEHNELVNFINTNSFADALDYMQKDKSCCDKLIRGLATYARGTKSSLKFKEEFLNQVKKDNEINVFNGHIGMRHFSWLQLCQIEL